MDRTRTGRLIKLPHATYVPDRGPGADLLALYRPMRAARAVDAAEAELVTRGEAFFHLPCTGHEGIAALHPHLSDHDWLCLHYRDKALQLARGVEPSAYFHASLCTAESQSAGRQMVPFLSDPGRRLVAQNIPVGNQALQAVGIAAAVKDRPGRPIVVCSVGDGTSQQGEVMEAIAEAVRSSLPVLFVIENNGYSISTPTRGRTLFSVPEGQGQPDRAFGLPIRRINGRDVARSLAPLGDAVAAVRSTRGPALVVFEVDRLCNHTNADDERTYRTPEEIATVRDQADPLAILRAHLLEAGHAAEELDRIDAEIDAEVAVAVEAARRAADPRPVVDAKAPLPSELADIQEYRGTPDGDRLSMVEALREVLRTRMASDPRVRLLGEDIEDPKGDVFGVTRGLTRAFPGRVENSALSESTIVGTAIGRALAGDRPVAFIQFADFLPPAFNQIATELGSMHWRTDGGWQAPVILLVACGGYRPGLGPFHAQTYESTLAHVPGLDVLMPSSAADAAGLLNAAFASGRPTVLFYPKVALNDRDRSTSADVDRQIVPLGKAAHLRRGDAVTIVTWGSTVPLAEKAADALEAAGFAADLLDLRSISPWDREAVCASARRTGKLVVIHEDNQTCGFGAEVVATVAEAEPGVRCRRVVRPDTYIPCNFANQLEILPSLRRTLTTIAELLDLGISWEVPSSGTGNLVTVEAVGSSPADQTVRVVTWNVGVGEAVRAGQPLADLEADKAVFGLTSPASGRVAALFAAEGEAVRIGSPLLQIEAEGADLVRRRPVREECGTPVLRPRGGSKSVRRSGGAIHTQVGLSAIGVASGSRVVTNDDLLGDFPGRTAADILQRTGIEARDRLGPGESALSLAVTAARNALEREGLTIQDIDALVCSTTTPASVTPSMACLVLHELCKGGPARQIPAHDVVAACSGYLYALAAGFDITLTQPEARVLVVTAEAMSTIANPADFDTAILLGDAASATILGRPEVLPRARFRLRRPILSAKGDGGRALSVGGTDRFFRMDGLRIYAEAVRQMIALLERACVDADLRVDDLGLIVPHQANNRIIEDIRMRLGLPEGRVYSNIKARGNTSSSTIPLCLAEIDGHRSPGERIGLTAFGGGLTSGAAILDVI